MTAIAELCRDIAFEAERRGATGNVHELWAVLEHLDDLRPHPALVVDVGSPVAVWWAWWSLCPNVIGVAEFDARHLAAFSGDQLPSTVRALPGDPAAMSTVVRVRDQVARRPVDVLVLAGALTADRAGLLWGLYAPMVRPGGRVLVRGIANPATPGVGAFWRGLQTDEQTELIGADNPDGYGVVTIPGQVK